MNIVLVINDKKLLLNGYFKAYNYFNDKKKSKKRRKKHDEIIITNRKLLKSRRNINPYIKRCINILGKGTNPIKFTRSSTFCCMRQSFPQEKYSRHNSKYIENNINVLGVEQKYPK